MGMGWHRQNSVQFFYFGISIAGPDFGKLVGEGSDTLIFEIYQLEIDEATNTPFGVSGVRITPLNRFHVDIEFKFLSDNDGIFILSLKIAHDHTEANVRSLWRSDVYKFTLDQMHCSVCYTKIDLSPPPTRYSETRNPGKSRGRESRQPSNPLITSHFGRSSFLIHFDNGFLIQKILQSTTVYRAFIDTVTKTIRYKQLFDEPLYVFANRNSRTIASMCSHENILFISIDSPPPLKHIVFWRIVDLMHCANLEEPKREQSQHSSATVDECLDCFCSAHPVRRIPENTEILALIHSIHSNCVES
ncbi:hypothetical protein GPALN_004478 [Globodera pallida]|nr:hypothetical protein GPALN_004478 [Globodera pallida]